MSENKTVTLVVGRSGHAPVTVTVPYGCALRQGFEAAEIEVDETKVKFYLNNEEASLDTPVEAERNVSSIVPEKSTGGSR